MSPAKPNIPFPLTSSERLTLTLQTYRLDNKTVTAEISKFKEEMSKKPVPVDVDLGKYLVTIMSENIKYVPLLNYFGKSNKNIYLPQETCVQYHHAIIRYCLGLATAAYDEISFDEKYIMVCL